MIVEASAPLRFSLGGGGTDLPAYASRFGGFVCTAAVDHRIVVRIGGPEEASDAEDPIVCAAKEHLGLPRASVASVRDDLTTRGAGLGASGSFTVALLAGLLAAKGVPVEPARVADLAYGLEREVLGAPIGRQDPTIAAYGGVIALTIEPAGSVRVEEALASPQTISRLERHLVAFFSGKTRSASEVLRDQASRIGVARSDEEGAMHRIKELGKDAAALVSRGDVGPLGVLFHEHWQCKRRVSPRISSEAFDETYALARSLGAEGGKLMGAGGGGYWLFFVSPANRRTLQGGMQQRGFVPFPFRFTSEGVRIKRLVAGG